MSFTQSSFGPISSHGNSDMPNIWTYRTDDTFLQISAEGYFQDKINQINNGDFINIDASSGTINAVFSKSGNALTVNTTSPDLTNRVVVTKSSDLSGVLDGTKEYFIDGVIDMGTQEVEVPQGGLNLTGYNFDLSKLISSASNYTMFTSPVSGSGNVLGKDYAIEVTGTSSQVYDIFSDTGNEAFEFSRINYNNCTSLGTITNYRQGLEVGSGRFGGKPELTLAGAWAGGYFIDTSIVRGMADDNYSLFKAGAGFVMDSRFRSNMNIDLPASASFFDFSTGNFTNPSTLQITGAIVTRDGVFDATDSNITPNITNADIASDWTGNNGMPNTFEGGSITVATEAATVIGSIGAFVDIAASSWTSTDLQHFDNPADNQLRHLGNAPREYKVVADYTIESTANDDLIFRVLKWDNSASSFSAVLDQARPVNNLSGGRNVAFFSVNINTTLDQNDYIKLQLANNTRIVNATAEVDSYYIIEQR